MKNVGRKRLTIREAAKVAGVDYSTACRWVKDGRLMSRSGNARVRLASHEMRGTTYVYESDLLKWIGR